MTEIIVVGYPKSGNTWLSRLLGDLYNCSVTGIGSANPLCAEERDTDSPHLVRQLHLKLTSIHDTKRPKQAWTAAVDNAYWFGPELWEPEKTKLIHIIRDPRDMAVSVQHYWNRDHLHEAVDAMCLGCPPLVSHGPWHRYIKSWIYSKLPIPTLKYEALSVDTWGVLKTLADDLGIEPINPIQDVVRRQSFKATRDRIQEDGNSRPYGKKIQLHNLRKGIVGDWRNHWTKELGRYADSYWQELLPELGWERNPDWYEELTLQKGDRP